MIIGVNGYMGAGKDTVGKIIQYLTASTIGISHLTDDEVARIIEGGTFSGEFFFSWEIKKYADKLKEIASLLTGIPKHMFEDQEFKKTDMGRQWDRRVKQRRKLWDEENIYWEEQPMTVREFLQRLGTEAIREGLHTNAWVNALFADYTPKVSYQGYIVDFSNDTPPEPIGKPVEGEYPDWVITDTRFPNEAQAIKDRGGIVVRVNRYQKSHKSVGLHPSEISLDDWDFDYTIDNNGSIDDLIQKVREMLLHFKILS